MSWYQIYVNNKPTTKHIFLVDEKININRLYDYCGDGHEYLLNDIVYIGPIVKKGSNRKLKKHNKRLRICVITKEYKRDKILEKLINN